MKNRKRMTYRLRNHCRHFMAGVMLCVLLAGCGQEAAGPAAGSAGQSAREASDDAAASAGGTASSATGKTDTVAAGSAESLTEEVTGDKSPGVSGPAGGTTAPAVNAADASIRFIPFETVHHVLEDGDPRDPRKQISVTYDTFRTGKKLADGADSYEALDTALVAGDWARERDCVNMFTSAGVAMSRAEAGYRFSVSRSLRVYRADSRVFSYLAESFETLDDGTGRKTADRAKYSCYVYNTDPETGAEIALEDVVTDREALAALASDAVIDKYVTRNPAYNAADQFESVDLEAEILALLEEEQASESGSFYAWSPCYYGLRLIIARDAIVDPDGYRAYLEEVTEVEPRDLKKVEIMIPYSAAPEIFNPAYTSLPDAYIAELEPGVTYPVDFGDGPEDFLVNAPRKYEKKTILYTGEYTIRTGDGDVQSFNSIGAEAYTNHGTRVYLVRRGEECYLYLDAQSDTAADRLHVYTYRDGAFTFTGVSEEMLDADAMPPFDPESFTVERIFLILPDPFDPDDDGTRALRKAYVAKNGMPASDEREYIVAEEDIRTTKTELMLDTIQDENNPVPVKEAYPAGTTLRMTAVSPASHADFETGDGRIVRMFINGVDTIDLIDGHEIHDAFEDTRLSE